MPPHDTMTFMMSLPASFIVKALFFSVAEAFLPSAALTTDSPPSSVNSPV